MYNSYLVSTCPSTKKSIIIISFVNDVKFDRPYTDKIHEVTYINHLTFGFPSLSNTISGSTLDCSCGVSLNKTSSSLKASDYSTGFYYN